MFNLKTCLVALAISLVSTASAQATTLANFTLTNGTYEIIAGQEITLTADFAWDTTAYLTAANNSPAPALPVEFNGSFILDGTADVTGPIGPVTASPIELFDAGFGIGAFVAAIVDQSNGVTPAPVYFTNGAGRTDLSDTVDLGPADLFFTFTGGATGPTTGSGSFTAVFTQTSLTGPSLTDMINNGLVDLSLLGTAFGPTGTGTFSGTIEVSYFFISTIEK